MILAQIKNGIIINVVVVDDETKVPWLTHGFDQVVIISQEPDGPGIGWTYDGENFIAPVVEAAE